MPMVPEIAVALFAVAKVGAIILPLFSGYGAAAVASRLHDAQAKFLITADGFFRRGEHVPVKQTADEALQQTPFVEHVVVFRRTGQDIPWQRGRDLWWEEVRRSTTALATERTDTEDPLMVIYTSGTTGKPKGILHTHCGFPIKAAQDMLHGLDVHREDCVYWVTDMGWMLGPWEVFGVVLSRCHDGFLRRRSRLSRRGPVVAARAKPWRNDSWRLTDTRAVAHAPRR